LIRSSTKAIQRDRETLYAKLGHGALSELRATMNLGLRRLTNRF
jgi:hypothetical protein